jgi:hypothetical protein
MSGRRVAAMREKSKLQPEGRMKLARRFNGGKAAQKAESPAGDG